MFGKSVIYNIPYTVSLYSREGFIMAGNQPVAITEVVLTLTTVFV